MRKNLRRLKKVVALLLICALLAGCGAGNKPVTEAETPLQTTVTAAPTTEAPTTAAPTTEAPTTAVPTTEAPTTAAPTTAAPTTAAPTTEAPTTAAPTTTSSLDGDADEQADFSIGRSEGRHYENAFFGIAIDFPKSYELLTQEELAQANGFTKAQYTDEAVRKALEEETLSSLQDCFASDGVNNTNIKIFNYPATFGSIDKDTMIALLKSYLSSALVSQYKERGYNIEMSDLDVEKMLISGQEIDALKIEGSIEVSGVHVSILQKVLLVFKNDYMWMGTVTAALETKLQEVLDTIRIGDISESTGGQAREELSEEFAIGQITGNHYENTYFGVVIDFPEGIELPSQDDVIAENGFSKEKYTAENVKAYLDEGGAIREIHTDEVTIMVSEMSSFITVYDAVKGNREAILLILKNGMSEMLKEGMEENEYSALTVISKWEPSLEKLKLGGQEADLIRYDFTISVLGMEKNGVYRALVLLREDYLWMFIHGDFYDEWPGIEQGITLTK